MSSPVELKYVDKISRSVYTGDLILYWGQHVHHIMTYDKEEKSFTTFCKTIGMAGHLDFSDVPEAYKYLGNMNEMTDEEIEKLWPLK